LTFSLGGVLGHQAPKKRETTTKEKAMTEKYTIEDVLERINGQVIKNGKNVVYYDDSTGCYYLAPFEDVEYLVELMNDDDEAVSRDAYSHWCAGTSHPECDEVGRLIKTYYIYTDSGSEEIKAASLEEALAEWGEAPKWVRDSRSFERWLNKVGGFGAIQEDGVEIARVDA
jgi:hypothetical protein